MSISGQHFLSFDEKMSHCWVPPKILESGSYLPMIYGKHGVVQIMDWVGGLNDAKAGPDRQEVRTTDR